MDEDGCGPRLKALRREIEIKITDGRVVPVFKIPGPDIAVTGDAPATGTTEEAVRAMLRSVDLLVSYSNLPDLRWQLDHVRQVLGSEDDSRATGFDGKVTKLPPP